MNTQVKATGIKQLPDIQLMPAALYYPNHGGYGIYIRWKGNGSRSDTHVLSASSWHIHFIAPDREVLVVGNLHQNPNDVSMSDWDEFIPLSVFHNQVISTSEGPRSIMVNAHQFKGKLHRSHNTREHFPQLPGTITIFGDSGGYQLRRKSEFIDPESVSEYYNLNVDYGTVLDFPLLDAFNWKNLEDAAFIQKENIEIMMRTLKPSVNLINIAHGVKTKHRLKFLDIVHDQRITSLAVAKSSYSTGIIAFVDGIYSFMTQVQKKYENHYKHLHILGLTDNKTFIPIMRMIALGLIENVRITMDSTTHLQMAISKTFFNSRHSVENYTPLRFGNDGNFPSSIQRTPCSCLVCRSVGWVDAFNILPGNSITTFLLMYHNIHAMDAYFNQMLWYTTHLSNEELILMCRKIFENNKSSVAEVEQALNFIHSIAEIGYKETKKKFKFYLNLSDQGKYSDIMSGSLLGGLVLVDQDELTDLEYIDQDDSGIYDYDKPLDILDRERMELFKNRLSAMNMKRQYNLENSILSRRKNKVSKKKLSHKITDEEGNEKIVTKVVGNKKKPELLGIKSLKDDKKILNVTKVRTGPSLSKHKQAIKSKINKKKHGTSKDSDTKVIMGKTVIKSKNRKKL